MKVKKTYRLEEKTINELEQLCKKSGRTATEEIEAAIRFAIREPYASHTQNETDFVNWQELYLQEKERNNELTNKLLEVSDKVADSLQAAQVLQAMEKPALENSEQKIMRTWWKFWK